jgi:hypothetical protein
VGTTRSLVEWRLKRLVRPANEPSYGRALSAWLAALRGHTRTLPTLTDGLRALELVHEAESSAVERAAVSP